MFCTKCGKEINNGAKFCSSCGAETMSAPFENNAKQEINKKKKGLAVASVIFGVIGGYPWTSTASIIAIVCGYIALHKIKKEPDKYAGKGLATAGLILGYLGLIIAFASGIMRGTMDNSIQNPLATPTKTVSELNKISDWSCGDVVAYSGQNYDSVQIGNQCWFKENLNVGVKIAGKSNAGNNGIIEKYCYNDNEANCATDGGLYQWDEAMAYSNTEGSQGICPNGWHIPSMIQIETLVEGQAIAGCKSPAGWWCGLAGTKLKVGGVSGFEGILTGARDTDGSFFSQGMDTRFWSSAKSKIKTDAWNISVFFRGPSNKALGFSVRCLKD